MELDKYQKIGIVIILLGVIAFAFTTGNIPIGEPTVATMDVSLLNMTGIVDVIIELETPPGSVATVQSQDIFIQEVRALNGAVTDTVSYVDNALRIRIDASKLSELAENPNVKYIIRNKEVWHAPSEGKSVGLADNRYFILDVLPLWEQGLTGKGVVVAVVDTGINSELDIFQRDGESIVIDSLELYGEYVMWHGTAVASCIASQDDVIQGIAPGVDLLNVEVFRPDGGAWTWDIVKGWDWVAQWKIAHPDKYVICCNSLGAPPAGLTGGWRAPGELDRPANNMVIKWDVAMIVAAGNGRPELPNTMLVNCPGQAQYVLTVGAIDFNNQIAYFSCRGGTVDGNPKPDVVAPGVSIRMFNDEGNQITASGTSFATPLTAGVAALVAENHKNYSAWQLQSSIKSGANRDVLPSAEYDTTYGYGVVDAQDSLLAIGTEPPKPTSTISNDTLSIVVVAIGAILVAIPILKKRR